MTIPHDWRLYATLAGLAGFSLLLIVGLVKCWHWSSRYFEERRKFRLVDRKAKLDANDGEIAQRREETARIAGIARRRLSEGR